MLTSTDGLTGLSNRRSFDKALTGELGRCARDHPPLVLLLVDVDHFNSYNDGYGHQERDDCLKRLSHLLRGMARRLGDVAARCGGEEFAVILPSTSAEGEQQFAEHPRTSVAATPHCRSAFGAVTVSIGLARRYPKHPGERRHSSLFRQSERPQSRQGLHWIDASHGREPLRCLIAAITARVMSISSAATYLSAHTLRPSPMQYPRVRASLRHHCRRTTRKAYGRQRA
jgi:diguanylate cyclase (GGDEF)-like protein